MDTKYFVDVEKHSIETEYKRVSDTTLLSVLTCT